MTANFSAQGGEAQINLFEILAESGKESLTITPFELNYYESLLDHTIRLTLQVADTGYRTKTSENAVAVRSQDLDGRYVNLKVTDAYQNELKFIGENKLRISNKTGTQESVNKMFFTLHLTSPEYHRNGELRSAVTKSYDGHPDESVRRILKEYIQTTKTVDADSTLNTLSFNGHSESPFFLCTWLASRSVPDIQKANQNFAGYFFYETADGYKFKSIDKLFSQTPKRKLIMNQIIGEIPPGYDGKVLDHTFVETFDLNHQKRYASGKSQIRTFDPFSQTYVQTDFDFQKLYQQTNTGGINPIQYGDDQEEVVSRYFTHLDTGVKLPGTVEEQLKKSNEVNYNPYDIFRQAKMRYNSLYNIKLSLVIAGDLSLRAGDLLYCDFPEVSGEKTKVVDSEKSGLYMIHDVCHRITKNGFFSGINLVRESIGRKPF